MASSTSSTDVGIPDAVHDGNLVSDHLLSTLRFVEERRSALFRGRSRSERA
jgi:hypothetical protein